jgi:hypothetical protein
MSFYDLGGSCHFKSAVSDPSGSCRLDNVDPMAIATKFEWKYIETAQSFRSLPQLPE